MPRRKNSAKNLEEHDVVGPAELSSVIRRTPAEVMESVMYAARVSAAQLAKLSEKQLANPDMVMSQLSTHKKVKVMLDCLTTMFAQPEILEPFIQDLMDDRGSRQGAFRAMLQTMPRELNLEVTNKTGVMLVPAKADNIDAWLAEAGIKNIGSGDGSPPEGVTP